jgi:hypothetical protein
MFEAEFNENRGGNEPIKDFIEQAKRNLADHRERSK